MSRRTERPYKADGTDKLAQHSKAPCSVPEVNGSVAQQEFTSLLREICAPSPPATAGAALREDRREGTEVSRGHSSSQTLERRPELVRRGSTPSPLNPLGRSASTRASVMTDGKHGTASDDL